MKLTTFIDNRFQEIRLLESESEKKLEYSLTRSSETLALQGLMTFIRSTVKWCMFPKIIGHYLLVQVKLAKAPSPVLINKLKEQQQKDLEAKAKKVGMLEMVKKEETAEPSPA